MNIKIEKGVPVPPKKGPHECMYPFADMKPGDSFAIPHGGKKYLMQSIAQSARKWAKNNAPGAKFTCRTEGENVRIWMHTRPASLAPISVAELPVAKAHKLANHEDERFDSGGRSSPARRTEGSGARVVHGKGRY
jgi:hypothetical protein